MPSKLFLESSIPNPPETGQASVNDFHIVTGKPHETKVPTPGLAWRGWENAMPKLHPQSWSHKSVLGLPSLAIINHPQSITEA